MKHYFSYYILLVNQMTKYKTIDPQLQRQSLLQAIQRRITTNRISGEGKQLQRALMSTNKSIIFIQLPKKQTPNRPSHHISFQSSLKRIKFQNNSHEKNNEQARLQNNNQENQIENLINRSFKDRFARKVHLFPQLNSFSTKNEEQKNSYFKYLKSQGNKKSVEKEEILQYNNPEKLSIFNFSNNGLGFKNLKQKYLELRQISLCSQKKSQLLDKTKQQENSNESTDKMEKKIQQHMDRYKAKDFFQAKIKGVQTKLFQDKAVQQTIKRRIRQTSQLESTSNFVFRRKMKSNLAYNSLNQSNQQSNLKDKTRYDSLHISLDPRQTLHNIKNRQKSFKEKKSDDCTPWQTDIINFDS